MRRCGILIPAYNEAETISRVIAPALSSGMGEVLVVDDGSDDETPEVANRAGARVLRLRENVGKGGAVWAGASELDAEVVVLLDADLTGLRPDHVRELAKPVVSGHAEMARGVFAGGRWSTAAAQKLAPQLNGQRAILKQKLLQVDNLAETRYGIEIAITQHAQKRGWVTVDVPMPGVSQVMKEEKRGVLRGFAVRLRMYAEIVATYVMRLSKR